MLRLPTPIKIASQFDTAVDYMSLSFYTAEVSLVLSFVGDDLVVDFEASPFQIKDLAYLLTW